MSYTPRKMAPGLAPVKLRVEFEAPDPAHIELQGPALKAYHEWLEVPSDENEEYLAECIYDQLEDHILMWSRLGYWETLP